MKDRLKRMERLRHLRALQELRRKADFVQRRIRLQQVERQIDAGSQAALLAVTEAQVAMEEGNRPQFTMAESLREIAFQSMAALQPARQEAIGAMEKARTSFVESKRETEQASLLAEGVRKDLLIESDRRTQAESDDRYAARIKWLRSSTLNNG